MSYRDLENEKLSVDEERIRELCGSLKRVDAPKDFNFRLKARIAAHQPPMTVSPFLAFLKFAAPFGLVILILGTFVFSNLNSREISMVSPSANSYSEVRQDELNLLSENKMPMEIASKTSGPNAESEATVVNTNAVSNRLLTFSTNNTDEIAKSFETPKKNRGNVMEEGGSRDFSSRQSTIINQQNGNNLNQAVPKNNTQNESNPFTIKQILSAIGIEADFSGSGWRVMSIRKNTLAETSEIKPNDIILTADGISLLREIRQISLIRGTKLSVVREGNRIEIVLK